MAKNKKRTSVSPAKCKEHLDSLSASFCAAKWWTSTIWFDLGVTSSCHHTPASPIDLQKIAESPSGLHNTVEKQLDRQQMKDGLRPKGCEYCWRTEDLSPTLFSDRVFKSRIYSQNELSTLFSKKATTAINPKYLELSFSRKCNLACSYCSPSYSSSWQKDIDTLGEYKDIKTSHYQSSSLVSDDALEKYVSAFWKWFPSLQNDLRRLRITGGEPLLSRITWDLIESFVSDRALDHIELAINTNLQVNSNAMERLLLATQRIGKFFIHTSNESTGLISEYLRDGIDFSDWCKNFDILIDGGFRKISVMSTVNAISVFAITDILEFIISRRNDSQIWPQASLNTLSHPSFYQLAVLPESLRKSQAQRIESWLVHNKDHLVDSETSSLKNIVAELNDPSKPELEKLGLQFKNFHQQFDKRRNKNILSIGLPDEFYSWYRDL